MIDESISLIDKGFLLKKTPLFSSLDIDSVLTIAEKSESLLYKEKEPVFSFGQTGYRLYIVYAGSINILDENKNLIKVIHKQDFFGDESMFNSNLRAYSAVCQTDTTLISLSKQLVINIIREHPSIAIYLLSAMAKNITFRCI